jgi:hypothetical protein
MRKNRIYLAGFLAFGIISAAGAGQDLDARGTPSPEARVKKADTFGTSSFSYQRVGFSTFVPMDSTMTYSDLNFSSAVLSRYPTNANGSGVFVAVPQLPSGALVSGVEFDWCDTSAASDLQFDVLSSGYTGEGIQTLASATSDGSLGCAFTIATLASPFTINNDGTQLILKAAAPTHDGTTSVSGAVVRYVLQVSPAPGTAFFNDVPLNDQGFQYVEAMLAAGVTGGCASNPPFQPPVYCPDSFVTRRQMAIFIAKALGLQWP